jgi:haloalkane dehalogenase
MVPADETFDGSFPFRPHFSSAPGFRMHYVDEGAGEPLVLLHGEPTWGYLYRSMIGPLAEHYRVVVPDHMGFGKSETPQDREYSLRAHVENLAALIEDLNLRNVTLVAQDWGGPIAAAYTLRHPDRVQRLFFANTLNAHAAVEDPDVPQLADSPWFRWIGEGLETGRYEAVLRNVGSTVLSMMKLLGFQNSAAVDDAWLRAYAAPFPTPEAAVGAYAWPIEAYSGSFLGYVAEGIEQQGGVEALRGKPAMLAEGLEDRAILPALAIANFRALWPDEPVVELSGVGHYCQEDAPATLVALIRTFVQTV